MGLSEHAIRGDCSTLPGNELPLIAEKVRFVTKIVPDDEDRKGLNLTWYLVRVQLDAA